MSGAGERTPYGARRLKAGQRVLVCGGREYIDREALAQALDTLEATHGAFSAIIHGGARGADLNAGEWARIRGRLEVCYPADWITHGKAAGPIRNRQMLTEGKPDIVVAFPGGRGTADMIRQAKSAGVPVIDPLPAAGERSGGAG